MIEILIYAFSIMYSPGPVNLIGMTAGISGHASTSWPFCFGVGCAMFILFALLGYTGTLFASPNYRVFVAFLGAIYIFWLATKLLRASAKLQADSEQQQLNFSSGLIMQLLNPKAFIAILPIVTVQFPAAGITGGSIIFWSALLGALAVGAPGSYMLMGAKLNQLITNPKWIRAFNTALAILLFYVAADMLITGVKIASS